MKNYKISGSHGLVARPTDQHHLELMGIANPQAPPWTSYMKHLGGELSNLGVNKPTRKIWCKLKLDEHCRDMKLGAGYQWGGAEST